jgi:hypothetical protein
MFNTGGEFYQGLTYSIAISAYPLESLRRHSTNADYSPPTPCVNRHRIYSSNGE